MEFTESNIDQNRNFVGPTIEILELMRVIHSDMTITQLAVMLQVMAEEGITVKEVGNRLALPSATLSRALGVMSKYHRGGREGLDLLKLTEDVKDRRIKIITLTPKGVQLKGQLKAIRVRQIERLREAMG